MDNGIDFQIAYLELIKWIDGTCSVDEFLEKWTTKERFAELKIRVVKPPGTEFLAFLVSRWFYHILNRVYVPDE